MDESKVPALTVERVRFVVKEHSRLMRKLKRTPGAHKMLAVHRLPDLAAGETIVDVIRPQIPSDTLSLMDTISSLLPEYTRIFECYMQVISAGEETALAAARVRGGLLEAELIAVAEAREEIELAIPRWRKIREGLERHRSKGPPRLKRGS